METEFIIHKSGGQVKAVESDRGDAVVIFGRTNVIDSDGDRFDAGSLVAKSGNLVMGSPWGHQLESFPIAWGPIEPGDDTEMLWYPTYDDSEYGTRMKGILADPHKRAALEWSHSSMITKATPARDRAATGKYKRPLNIQNALVLEISPQYKGATPNTGIKVLERLKSAIYEESDNEDELELPKPDYLLKAQFLLSAYDL